MEVGTLVLRTTSFKDEFIGVTQKDQIDKRWYFQCGQRMPVFGPLDKGTWEVLGTKEFVEWRT